MSSELKITVVKEDVTCGNEESGSTSDEVPGILHDDAGAAFESNGSAKIFVIDREEMDFTEYRSSDAADGTTVSQLRLSCVRSVSTNSLESSGKDENRVDDKGRKTSNHGSRGGEKDEINEDTRLDLSKALDELSVATSEAEDLKEALASGYQRQSVMGFDSDEDFVTSSEWKHQKRHIFVLSESGKPIYSRYGNEENLVTIFGLMQALVSVAQDNDDAIRSMHVGETTVVFLGKPPLILVCVSRRSECVAHTQTQLMYFYNQIVSILTLKQLTAIFEKRRNYDLRRLLSGSERLLDNLATLVEDDPSYLLGAVRCLPLAPAVRETISQTIIQNLNKQKNLVFAILVGNNQLISCVRMKKCFMHPMDLHIILNLIDASESFKTAESWTPICLPRFDSDGFVHGHVSYLADDCQACLVLLTVDRESFFALSEAKQKIVERLRRHNILEAINTSMNNPWPTLSGVNIPEIRHFLYKSRSIAQFVSPTIDIPYINAATNRTVPAPDVETVSTSSSIREALNAGSRTLNSELRRLHSSYFRLHARIHSHSRPLKLIYCVDDTENWIGWLTTSFEMYVAFEPLTKKASAINAVNKLLKWVKKEEDRMFITNSPTF